MDRLLNRHVARQMDNKNDHIITPIFSWFIDLVDLTRCVVWLCVFAGEPIADAFAVCARSNSALLIVADGVNWGEKSMLAARCAVYGCVQFINQQLFCGLTPITTTHVSDVSDLLPGTFNSTVANIPMAVGGIDVYCYYLARLP